MHFLHTFTNADMHQHVFILLTGAQGFDGLPGVEGLPGCCTAGYKGDEGPLGLKGEDGHKG